MSSVILHSLENIRLREEKSTSMKFFVKYDEVLMVWICCSGLAYCQGAQSASSPKPPEAREALVAKYIAESESLISGQFV